MNAERASSFVSSRSEWSVTAVMNSSVREAKRVVLCDDHEIVREAIKARMASSNTLQIVGEAGDGRDVVEVVKELEPDVLIIDVELPEARRDRGHQGGPQGPAADQSHHLHRPRPAGPAGTGAAGGRLRLRPQVGAGRGHRPRGQSGHHRRHLPRRRLRRRQALRGRETARPLPARAPDPRAPRRGPAGEGDRRAARAQPGDRPHPCPQRDRQARGRYPDRGCCPRGPVQLPRRRRRIK